VGFTDRLVVRAGGRLRVIAAEEIDWMEAAANYVRIHAGGEAHLVRRTMRSLEEEIDPGRFVRIHRCRIVNVERIKEMEPISRGRYVIVLRGGEKLTLSRGRRAGLADLLGKWPRRAPVKPPSFRGA
jgi:two-component system, LytTR family, response regulator